MVGTGDLFSQKLEDFQYVRVPEKFEFLKHENQFEVNALTAFLFEKYGFNVIYKEGVPPGLDVCDILQANVHSKSGLFRSRLFVTLEDCNGREIFTSQVGVSAEKDFRKSYHQALRDAFTSFEDLQKKRKVIVDPVSQDEELNTDSVPAEVVINPTPVTGQPAEVIIDPVVTAEENEKVSRDEVKLVNGTVTYILTSTPEGFIMHKGEGTEKFATLIKSGGGDNYLYSSKNVSGNAFFDTNGNLIVEFLDPNTQQLVNIIYKPGN
ncbi:hypothetical protein [Salinimicrobium sp. HB62]|uniref:hypothetical protein n=1 Tax=Salinimicrobium sp. HB62 TaxID=3077781 RepID=UPI002D769BC1|nr:hypothetical protein [Salinimicrobium sp. HB62]